MAQKVNHTVWQVDRAMSGFHRWLWVALAAVTLLVTPAAALSPAGSKLETEETVNAGSHLDKPYLWVIERDPPCFLFGTIHVPDARVTRMPPMAISAISASDSVYTEVPMDLLSTTRAGLMVMDLTGPGLREKLPPELYARAAKQVEAQGMQMASLDKMKVWSFMAMLPMLEYLDDARGNQALDQVIYSRASRLKKKVGGIETIDEQLGYFEKIPMEDQLHLLDKTLTHLEETAGKEDHSAEELVAAYMSGDPDSVMAYSVEEMDLNDPVEQRFFADILTKRNVNMADRVDAKLREFPDRAFFFAFGLLHFPGDEGVVALLEEKGWRVTRAAPGTEFAPRPTPTPAPTTSLAPSSTKSNPFAP